MKKVQKIEWLSVQDMNNCLKKCKNKLKVYRRKRDIDRLDGVCYIDDGPVNFRLTTHINGKIRTFICRKDKLEHMAVVGGGAASLYRSNYFSIPERPCEYSATPLIDYDPDYQLQRIEAWGYDLNSAYAATLLRCGWIDTSVPPAAKVIGENEIGFTCYEMEDGSWSIQHEGYCEFVFKRVPLPSGVRAWINKCYEGKKNAKDKQEKALWKGRLNSEIGNWQNKNPWLRMWVVCNCNEYIMELLDEDSLFWNTDSIVSARPRPDLVMGTDIGEWKLEHHGMVAYKGNAYQWDNHIPTYRGVAKSRFFEGWDICKDPIPEVNNPWVFNKEKFILEYIGDEYGEENI